EKKPAPKPPSPRVWSPLGAGSTLITSAPSSAKISPAVGPITVWVNSRTLSPASGNALMIEPAAPALCVLRDAPRLRRSAAPGPGARCGPDDCPGSRDQRQETRAELRT